jgi:RsiW-degrading membrane proteinase PrsW (M82 family)
MSVGAVTTVSIMSVSGVGMNGSPEAWERMRDGVRLRLTAVLSRYPALVQVLPRLRVWSLWAALALVLVLAIAVPDYRAGLWAYACCFWLLVVWFLLARTKTVTWAGVARMFTAGVVWSWVIAFVSFRLAAASGVAVDAAGPGTAIAALTEETFKLLPLAVLALVAPGRVRRFATVDWLLLGLASGLGFQAWEDLLRRTAGAVRPPGALDFLFQLMAPHNGSPQYGLGPLSGGSSIENFGDVYGYAGHHVFTGLMAGAVGLGVAAWRRSSLPWRVLGVVLPALMLVMVAIDHFGFNATLHDNHWMDAPQSKVPGAVRAVWAALGSGTGKGWLLLVVLVVCLFVDTGRLQAAGSYADLPPAVPRGAGHRWPSWAATLFCWPPRMPPTASRGA